MGTSSATERKVASADDLFDMARTFADGSADPGATYEGFLRGLEMGLTYNTLDPVASKNIGNRLADLRPATGATEASTEDRVIVDPTRKVVRTVPRPGVAADTDFPTEWTLDPG